MAHGERAERLGHAGREYWSPRDPSMPDWGKSAKKRTHRRERTRRHREVYRVLKLVREGWDADEGEPPWLTS